MSAEPRAAFERFAQLRRTDAAGFRRDGGLSDDTLSTYRSVWNLWCQWLAEERLPWDAAAASDMQRFLLTPQARAHGGLRTSEVTKRRYWRILRDIYQAAACTQEGATNQFANPWEVGARELEMNARSMVFQAPEMAAFRHRIKEDLAHVEASLEAGMALEWIKLRDAALLALLFSTAAKVSEIRLLRPEHLLHRAETNSSGDGGIRYARLENNRPGSHGVRKLALDDTAARALTIWLDFRTSSGLDRAAPLFIRNKGGTAMGTDALSAVSVFKLVGRFVAETLPGRAMLHVGPESIRNSVIREWMVAGVAEHKILEDAGVKDSKILRRLERAC